MHSLFSSSILSSAIASHLREHMFRAHFIPFDSMFYFPLSLSCQIQAFAMIPDKRNVTNMIKPNQNNTPNDKILETANIGECVGNAKRRLGWYNKQYKYCVID